MGALRLGLVNKVVCDNDLSTEAAMLCAQLAKGAPKAMAATKRLLWNGLGSSAEVSFPEEARTQSVLAATADAREGLAAVIDKRRPNFVGE